MKKILVLVWFSAFLFSCKNDNKVERVERAFYYWKGNSLGQENLGQIKKLKLNKLYVKLFEKRDINKKKYFQRYHNILKKQR